MTKIEIKDYVARELVKINEKLYENLKSEQGIPLILETIAKKQKELVKKSKVNVSPAAIQKELTQITSETWAKILSENITNSFSESLTDILSSLIGSD